MQIIRATSLEPGINLFPGTTNVVSFSANINLGTGLQLAPQKNGQFQLVAYGSLLASKDSPVEINQIDLLPEQYGTIINPLSATEDKEFFFNRAVDDLWNASTDFSLAGTKTIAPNQFIALIQLITGFMPLRATSQSLACQPINS